MEASYGEAYQNNPEPRKRLARAQKKKKLKKAGNNGAAEADLRSASPADKPITAMPVGDEFAVETRGDRDYNHIAHNPGCYRRVPTCRE